MTNETDFFDGTGGGSGAPTAQLANVGDYVHGQIVDMYKRDYVPYGKKEPELREDGTKKQQLVIILQTTFTGWAGCTKVPLVDPQDESKGYKTPDQDDGKRAVYVPEGKNIQFAIGRAASAAQVRPAVGGTLGVKVTGLRDTGKGNPLKEHEAVYTPPSAGSEFFAQAPAAPAAPTAPAQAPLAQGSSFGGGDRGLNAPAPAPAPAAPAPAQQAPAAPAAPPAAPAPAAAPTQDPWATPAAAAPAAAAAAPSQDPWAAPAAPTSQPPF